MKIVHCPRCDTVLLENSQECWKCGEPSGSFAEAPEDARAGQEVSASAGGGKKTRPLAEHNRQRNYTRSGGLITAPLLDEEYEDSPLDFDIEDEVPVIAERRHGTWQKVVEAPSRPAMVHPPRPPRPPQSHPILRYMPYGRMYVSPVVLFWCCIVVLFLLVGGGVFGIMGTLGRGTGTAPEGPTLQVTPQEVAIGATIYLRGSGFSRNTQLGLTRDAAIPVPDTNGSVIITSQADGSFTDTVVVGPDWADGTHTMSIEDALTHKFTSAPVQVTGTGNLMGPAHLRISESMLNLGGGDQATISSRKVALTNTGGGEISWRASARQPWLTISPKSGVFSSGMRVEVEIAGNRAALPPGAFNDQVVFSSDAGDTVLPVAMSVAALAPQGIPVLQVAPATLSFNANDGDAAPDAQAVTISNPGSSTLRWSATADVPWLSLSTQSGAVESSASQSTAVHVNTSHLLPGTYQGTITLSGDDTTLHNQQRIGVTVTIAPGCALAVTPNMLTFAGTYQQPAPAARALALSINNCSSAIQWKASSDAPWLTVDQASGSTPASPRVGIDTSNLKPGTYSGSVTFSSRAGTQQVPVRFVMNQPARPALSVSAATGLSFQSSAGQQGTGTRTITLTNTGSGTLFWKARTTTGNSGNWLSLSSSSGSIGAHQSADLSIFEKTPATMQPGTYAGSVTISATDQQGNEVAGSPQRIAVSVINAQAPPASPHLTVSPAALTFTVADGRAAQSVTLNNSGGSPVHWQASLRKDAPSFVSLSQGAASNLAAGESATFNVNVDATNLPGGKSYSTALLVRGIDPASGNAKGGQSFVIPITINITSPAPTPVPTPALAPTPTPAPRPTAAPTPAVVPIPVPTAAPTPVSTPTPVPVPTPTAVPKSTPTPIPEPTAAPTPVPTPVSTPTPVPVPTPTAAPKVKPTPIPEPTSVPTAAPTPVSKAPRLQVNTTQISFSATAGTNPAPQAIILSNPGRARVSWQVGEPSQPWLRVSQFSGSSGPGSSSTLTLSADTTGLAPGVYTAQFILTPASGPPVTLQVLLKVSRARPSPPTTLAVTPIAVLTPVPAPTPVPTSQPVATPTPSSLTTPTPRPRPTATAVANPTTTPTPAARETPISISASKSAVSVIPTPEPTSHIKRHIKKNVPSTNDTEANPKPNS